MDGTVSRRISLQQAMHLEKALCTLGERLTKYTSSLLQISFLGFACWRRQFIRCNASTVHMRQLFFSVPKMATVVRDSLRDSLELALETA
jgi:hypothetical protein